MGEGFQLPDDGSRDDLSKWDRQGIDALKPRYSGEPLSSRSASASSSSANWRNSAAISGARRAYWRSCSAACRRKCASSLIALLKTERPLLRFRVLRKFTDCDLDFPDLNEQAICVSR